MEALHARIQKVAITLKQLGFADIALRVEAASPGKIITKIKPKPWQSFKHLYPTFSKEALKAVGVETANVMRTQLDEAGHSAEIDSAVVPMYYTYIMGNKADPLTKLVGQVEFLKRLFNRKPLEVAIVSTEAGSSREAQFLNMWVDLDGNFKKFPGTQKFYESPKEAADAGGHGGELYNRVKTQIMSVIDSAVDTAKTELMQAVQKQAKKRKKSALPTGQAPEKGTPLGSPLDRPRSNHPGQP